MLDRVAVEEAIAVHEACYGLLTWLQSAVDRGFVQVQKAHGYMSESQAAADWIGVHYANIPARYRPRARSGEELKRFANYFASYLKASFDLHERPSRKLVSACGCFCPFCSYVGQAPHLKPKKLTAVDHRRAVRLKRDYVEAMGLQCGVAKLDSVADRVLADKALGPAVTLATYGAEMLRRCDGRPSSAAVLVLWREIAWKSGAPRRGFRLDAAAVLDADRRVREAMSGTYTTVVS